jgi:hypothetical protein
VGLADRAMRTQIKKTLRGRLNRARQAIKKLPEPDFYRPVLLKCVRHLRFTLLARGLAPFELGGLQMVQQLTTLEASLCRAQEKGGHRLLNRLIKIASLHRFYAEQATRLPQSPYLGVGNVPLSN